MLDVASRITTAVHVAEATIRFGLIRVTSSSKSGTGSGNNLFGLPIGLEQPLCGLDVRGEALEPACHEKINPRGKSQLSRCQHQPRVQALIGWSLGVVACVHISLLISPIGLLIGFS